MRVNHTGISSGALACLLALSMAGCAVPDGEPTSTNEPSVTTKTEALESDSGAFARLFGGLAIGGPRLAFEVTLGRARLCQLQADIIGDGARNGLDDADPDDGGWDFTLDTSATEHTANPSPSNTYGATALPLIVRARPREQRALGCALDAALGMQGRPEVDSPPDFVYLVLLGDVVGNPGFAQIAAARYDAKVSEAGGAQALGESIQDLRHNDGDDGLIAYDLAWLTFAALALDTVLPGEGYDADANQYATLIADDLVSPTPLFDMNDPSEAYYTDGLSWSIVALDATRLRPGLPRTLRQLLVPTQLDNGAFPYNQDFPEPDLQATSGAVFALQLSANTESERIARRRGLGYLVAQQGTDGGWDVSPGVEGTLASAEALLVLALSPETPLPPPSEAAITSAVSARGIQGSGVRGIQGSGRPRAAPVD